MKPIHYAISGLCALTLSLPLPTQAMEKNDTATQTPTYADLMEEMRLMRDQMRRMEEKHAREINALRSELAATPSPSPAAPAPVAPSAPPATGEESLYRTIKNKVAAALPDSAVTRAVELDASVVIDGFYYHDDSNEGLAHVKEEISGFGHSHGADDHHHHAEIGNGFNLRHVELGLSAAVDPYFRAWSTLAFDDDGSELEEAVMQTSSLPWGVTLSGGKMYSGIGRINRQHSHNWDFFDQPLVYELLFGSHNLLEKGMQATWLAPTPFYLLLGGEAFNGDNEKMFQKVDADELASHDGPRLFTGFVKFGPNLPGNHAAQLGLSWAQGTHQEAHDGNGDGSDDHWLDGHSTLWGADLVYKYDDPRQHGRGDLLLQAEYFLREKDLAVERHDLMPPLTGRDRLDRQDGYYLQGTYGILPRWRAGLRWEEVGLTNDSELPNGADEQYGSSSRISAMLDWKPTEFSLLRLQSALGDYATEDGDEDVWEVALQWQVTFGKHAAHDF